MGWDPCLAVREISCPFEQLVWLADLDGAQNVTPDLDWMFVREERLRVGVHDERLPGNLLGVPFVFRAPRELGRSVPLHRMPCTDETPWDGCAIEKAGTQVEVVVFHPGQWNRAELLGFNRGCTVAIAAAVETVH